MQHNFNIEHLDPIGNHVKKAYIPAYFIHGEDDDFIMPHHSQQLYDAYGGPDKRIKIVPGYHSSHPETTILTDHNRYSMKLPPFFTMDSALVTSSRKTKHSSKSRSRNKKKKEKNPNPVNKNFNLREKLLISEPFKKMKKKR